MACNDVARCIVVARKFGAAIAPSLLRESNFAAVTPRERRGAVEARGVLTSEDLTASVDVDDNIVFAASLEVFENWSVVAVVITLCVVDLVRLDE